jgi:hypothetical protein
MVATVCLIRRIRRREEQAGDRIFLWWVFWSFAVLSISGTFYAHYFLQIIAPFSVLTAYGLSATWKWAKSLSPLFKFVARGVWTIILVIILIIFVRNDYKYFFSYTPEEQTVSQYKSLGDLIDLYGLNLIYQREIAFYIREHTDPKETIYVWGMAPQIYFLAQRKAATRYRNNFNMAQLVTDNSLKALQVYAPMVIEDIKKSSPSYIVQIFLLEHFPDLQKFVRDHYMLDKVIEMSVPPYEFRLYRRYRDIEVVPNLR